MSGVFEVALEKSVLKLEIPSGVLLLVIDFSITKRSGLASRFLEVPAEDRPLKRSLIPGTVVPVLICCKSETAPKECNGEGISHAPGACIGWLKVVAPFSGFLVFSTGAVQFLSNLE